MPAIFVTARFARDGGLISYVADFTELFRHAADYVDRILRGEKPADLPVQTPTKFNTAMNIKTAKVLGLTVRPTLLATADEAGGKADMTQNSARCLLMTQSRPALRTSLSITLDLRHYAQAMP